MILTKDTGKKISTFKKAGQMIAVVLRYNTETS